ncbi:MAG: DUF1292 domain-containing protein [Lachnospiraceae bacterium]|nr:DUF1292 domain-containing protein [Lachnospiraceae bacterium]
MADKNKKPKTKPETKPADDTPEEEEMTVTLELEDGTSVDCAVLTIFDMDDRDYIALLPLDEKGDGLEEGVWIYRYSENPDDPNEEPVLTYIDDDDEYDAASDRFDEILDNDLFEDLDLDNMDLDED